MPPLGSNSPKTSRTSVVEPLVSAYAVAAAGNNSNSTHSSTEDNNTVDLVSPFLLCGFKYCSGKDITSWRD